MNYDELLTFLTVCERGSIIQAAHSLYIEQGTASRRIARLEKELGLSLFSRNRGQRETFLTEAGREFYPIARQMMALLDDANYLKSRQVGHQFRVTATNSLHSFYLLPLYKTFMNLYSSIEIYSQVEHSMEIFEMVERQETDLGFVTNLHSSPEVAAKHLLDESLVLLFHKKSDFAKSGRLEDLRDSGEIYFRYSSAYQDWHQSMFPYARRKKITLGNMVRFEQFLDDKESWAIVPERRALEYLKDHPDWSYSSSQISPPKRTIYAIWNRYPRPGARENISHFLELFASTYRRTHQPAFTLQEELEEEK